MLVNNSDRPLILLAGEIVTGGKQDRVVGKDRIVPPQSDPIDLSVFCVEPGRWVARSVERTGGSAPRGYPADSFTSFSAQMAQPSVRKEAMAAKDQQKVWDEVHKSAAGMAAALPPPAKPALESTSSYAGVMENVEVQRNLNSVAAPIERSYESLIRELRAQNAVGVVVAVNGEIIWADVFASTALLEKYWPKLVRSYAAEAMTSHVSGYPDLKWRRADVRSAQAFLEHFEGRRESVESEPGVYRHTEIYGDGFTAFELASLLPGAGFDVHLAKMTE
jgi:sulfur carrier protein ThiS